MQTKIFSYCSNLLNSIPGGASQADIDSLAHYRIEVLRSDLTKTVNLLNSLIASSSTDPKAKELYKFCLKEYSGNNDGALGEIDHMQQSLRAKDYNGVSLGINDVVADNDECMSYGKESSSAASKLSSHNFTVDLRDPSPLPQYNDAIFKVLQIITSPCRCCFRACEVWVLCGSHRRRLGGYIPLSEGFSEVRTTELFAKLEDIVASSGGSNPIPQSVDIGVSSSSAPVAPVVPGIPPSIASPTFAADLHHDYDDQCDLEDNRTFGELVTAVANIPRTPLMGGQISELEGVEEALREDEKEDEPELVPEDSDDDDRSIPVPRREPASSGSHQYPEHFSSLDIDVVSPTHEDNDAGTGFGGGGSVDVLTPNEFEIGQIFQTKEDAVLSVKSYSIRRGVEYKVKESNHAKYHARCKNFGSGCEWLICVALPTRKGFWEVRRYNGS
ncbi:hypothetical protein PIB30_067445 [Stylosanthes scabra]|uniref:Transposase MuDR plant domain-containing protein n=1 Tax=Stylosanthes scabra TaxID=79078 RepID=A0ABU6WNM6_9FABA|nr:hypothetical protein [Stylosanthes scabra]